MSYTFSININDFIYITTNTIITIFNVSENLGGESKHKINIFFYNIDNILNFFS